MKLHGLETVAAALVADGKGILAADETVGTLTKRFEQLEIASGAGVFDILGGRLESEGFGIAVDSSGNAYLTGTTFSSNFPTTTTAFQTTFSGSYSGNGGDAFMSELNRRGSALLYSTYLGGSNGDEALEIALDSAGNTYVTGFTFSGNFPTTAGAFQKTDGGGADAFVSKLAHRDDGGTFQLYCRQGCELQLFPGEAHAGSIDLL